MTRIPKIKVPVNASNQLVDPDHLNCVGEVHNFTFERVLQVKKPVRGHAQVWLEDEDGNQYTMFLTELCDMLRQTVADNGRVAGLWTYCKKGSRYGLRYLEEIGHDTD